jgi:hypothetical protein
MNDIEMIFIYLGLGWIRMIQPDPTQLNLNLDFSFISILFFLLAEFFIIILKSIQLNFHDVSPMVTLFVFAGNRNLSWHAFSAAV